MQTLQDIWSELGTRLRRFIGGRVNDPHAADDLTQDVLLKVQTQLDKLPEEDKLPAWVFAVARNAVVDHYRARATRNHADLTGLEPDAATGFDEQKAVIDALSPCVDRMVQLLPEPYREAMRMADIEGLSQQAVADRLALSLSGAKSRVKRARQQLRELLVRCCNVVHDGRGNVMNLESTVRCKHYCGTEDDTGKAKCGL